MNPSPHHWKTWLAKRRRHKMHLPDHKRAAVLIGLTLEEQPKILLTVRSAHLPTHKGQIAFPGGKIEQGESIEDAALREAEEEVHLPPNNVTTLGRLDDEYTPTGYHVTPVLACFSPDVLLSCSDEVDQILWPPLYKLREQSGEPQQRKLTNGQIVELYTYYWQSYRIWGMTGRMIHTLLEEIEI